MATKTFATPEVRQPRGVRTDPAFRAGASAFPEPAPQPEPVAGHSGPGAAAPAPASGAAAPPTGETVAGEAEARVPSAPADPPTLAASANASAVLLESKMTIYPGVTERSRLASIKQHQRLAESIVAEYALEQLFQHRTDEEIATVLRGRGHGLRRARTAPAP